MSHLKVKKNNSPCSPVQKVCSNVLDVGEFYTYIASDGTRKLCRIPVGETSNTYYKRTYCLFVCFPGASTHCGCFLVNDQRDAQIPFCIYFYF